MVGGEGWSLQSSIPCDDRCLDRLLGRAGLGCGVGGKKGRGWWWRPCWDSWCHGVEEEWKGLYCDLMQGKKSDHWRMTYAWKEGLFRKDGEKLGQNKEGRRRRNQGIRLCGGGGVTFDERNTWSWIATILLDNCQRDNPVPTRGSVCSRDEIKRAWRRS